MTEVDDLVTTIEMQIAKGKNIVVPIAPTDSLPELMHAIQANPICSSLTPADFAKIQQVLMLYTN